MTHRLDVEGTGFPALRSQCSHGWSYDFLELKVWPGTEMVKEH